MSQIKCEECNGTGEAVYSCCTGEVVVGDILMCPSCYEHLGEETCQACLGTGQIEEEDAQFADKVDPQLQAELRAEYNE